MHRRPNTLPLCQQCDYRVPVRVSGVRVYTVYRGMQRADISDITCAPYSRPYYYAIEVATHMLMCHVHATNHDGRWSCARVSEHSEYRDPPPLSARESCARESTVPRPPIDRAPLCPLYLRKLPTALKHGLSAFFAKVVYIEKNHSTRTVFFWRKWFICE